MTPKQDLEKILSELSALDAARIIIGLESRTGFSLVGDEGLISINAVDKLVEDLRSSGKLHDALELTSISWNREQRRELLEELGYFKGAAKIYEAEGFKEAAIRLYERAESWFDVGRVYEELDNSTEAINAYIKGKFFYEAAVLEEKRWNIERAIELYVEEMKETEALPREQRGVNDFYKHAGKLAESLGLYEIAVDFFVNYCGVGSAIVNAHGMELAIKEGLIDKAIEIAQKKRWEFRVADLFQEYGFPGKSREWVAQFAEEQENSNPFQAAELYKAIGQPEKAIMQYERAGQFGHAHNVAQEYGLDDKIKPEWQLEVLALHLRGCISLQEYPLKSAQQS